jgi:hypothetical protein
MTSELQASTQAVNFNEVEDTPAYAKIQGYNILRFITKLNVFLGREVSLVDYKQDEEVLFVSDSNKISRKHLQIFWDEERGGWFAKNWSKNHVYINREILKVNSQPVRLTPVSIIQMDECKLYFFQAREENDN